MVESTSKASDNGIRVCSSMNQDYEVMDKMGQGNAAVFVVTHKKFKERGDCAMKSLSYNESAIKEVLL